MTRMLSAVLALPLLSPVLAQEQDKVVGSGVVITETRKLAEFDQIELRVPADVLVTIGKPTPLEIKADDNILPLIKTEVRDRRLVISTDRTFKTKRTPDLKITTANLTDASISGSGDMHIRGVNNRSLSLNASGSGDFCFEGKTGNLAVSVTGSGDAQLTGKADQLTASVSGSGDIRAFSLTANRAAVSVKGSGDAKVNVTRSLSIQIFGSGDVHYKGNPTVSQQVAGSGDVKRRK